MNFVEFKPNLQDIINLIHDMGGVTILAHPFQYKFNDTEKFLNDLFKMHNLDGIECFYTTFSEEQTKYLVNFAKENNLLMSGGSDYHGDNKKNHELGVGKGNLNISDEIITKWDINYFN